MKHATRAHDVGRHVPKGDDGPQQGVVIRRLGSDASVRAGMRAGMRIEGGRGVRQGMSGMPWSCVHGTGSVSGPSHATAALRRDLCRESSHDGMMGGRLVDIMGHQFN